MRTRPWLILALGLLAVPAHGGTITSTIWGIPQITVIPLTAFTVDNVLTVGSGDTPIGGPGAELDLSFTIDAPLFSIVSLTVGPVVAPTGWIVEATPSCSGNFCEGFLSVRDPTGTGQTFAPGATFQLPSVVVSLTNLPVGEFLAHTSFAGAGDDIVASTATGSVASEYNLTAASFEVVPEPGTAALLALGLLALGAAGRGPPG